MAKYKLLQKAYIADQYLEAGTVIGDGTPYLFQGRPGPHMEPLDADARMKMKEAIEHPEIDPVHANHPGEKFTPGGLDGKV